jgi:taurine dioxygenase
MGEPTIGHAVFGHIDDFPEIYSVAKFRTAQTPRGARPQRPWTGWHTDITAALNPPKASILRGVTIPPYGGDTFWTNLAVAYQGLSETMRGIVDGLAASIDSRRPPVAPRARPTTRASAAARWKPSIRSCACIPRRESTSCSSVRRS